jgi:hypothetical protein
MHIRPEPSTTGQLLFGWEFTSFATEAGAKLSLNDLEAGSDKKNSWRPGGFALREAN